MKTAIDFSEEPLPRSINGFPVSFRSMVLPDDRTVWVPRGISRNQFSHCWRLYVVHEAGLLTTNIYDNGDPVRSLHEAYNLLIGSLEGVISRFDVDRRQRVPGFERDPLIDTGFTGVTVGRSVRSGKKQITVNAAQMIEGPSGKIEGRKRYVGSIAESEYEKDPESASQNLAALMKEAVAIRRHYNKMRSLGVYATQTYGREDVGESILSQPAEFPDFDVEAIFDSFVVVPRPHKPVTTGGDPESLAKKLKVLDLTKPQKSVTLNDRQLRFYRREIEGQTLFLPYSVFRARGEWRVVVAHRSGTATESVPDTGSAPFFSSLQEAWSIAVGFYQDLPPQTGPVKRIRHPILDTGIPSVLIQPVKRWIQSSPEPQWSFAVKVHQKTGSGKTKTQTIDYWALKNITNSELRNALCRAAATMAYREHLVSGGASMDSAIVDKDDEIPSRFWPTGPVREITVDDLRYYAEQQSEAHKKLNELN